MDLHTLNSTEMKYKQDGSIKITRNNNLSNYSKTENINEKKIATDNNEKITHYNEDKV